MKKLLCVLSIFILLMISNVYADGYEPMKFMGVVEVEDSEIVPYEYNPRMRAMPPDWLSDGSRNLYNYCGTLPNGNAKQIMYNKIYNSLYHFTCDASAKVTDYTYYTNDGTAVNTKLICTEITELTQYYSDSSALFDEAFTMIKVVIEDNPQFFYAGKRFYGFSASGKYYLGTEIIPSYVNYDNRMEEVDAISEGIAEYDSIISPDMSCYSIEKKVHDKIVNDNVYNSTAAANGYSQYPYAYSIAGSLSNGYTGGVCESYSETAQLLFNRYGVHSYLAAGRAGENHQWNIVELDNGELYCLDITWDDPVSTDGTTSYLRYKYFNMPGTQFYESRDNSLSTFPEFIGSLTLSDSTDYYTKAPDKVVLRENGRIVYQAPDLSEDETRQTTTETTTESTTEATTAALTETTEVTTGEFQAIVDSSAEKFIVQTKGTWQYAQFSNGTPLALARSNGAEISFRVDDDCTVSVIMQINNAADSFNVYVGDNLIYEYKVTEAPAGLNYSFHASKGQVVRIVYNMVASNGYVYNIRADYSYDVNNDGKVNLLDVIAILNKKSITSTELPKYDIDGDGMLSNRDAAKLLRRIANI